ncbi:FtsX-like permease family protein, partial [candidate division GN15 bacterium]|nr:FtsX-like permease family protein [candidate division GN15 bacterium]
PLIVRTPAPVEHGGVYRMLIDAPEIATDEIAASFRDAGFLVTTRDEAGAPDDAITALIYVLGTIGLFEAALVIATTFAVGFRRRQRELGLVAAVGASGSDIRLALLVSSLLLAGIGCAIGVVLGAGVMAAATPWLDAWNNRDNGAFVLSGIHIIMAVLLGLLTTAVAAHFPARRITRMSVRQALSSRRPTGAKASTWLLSGLLIAGAGLALLFLLPRDPAALSFLGIVGGSILGVLGFGIASPWLLTWTARHAGRLPLVGRLAVRDAGRFSTRNGPVVTAVLAGMAMSMTVAVLVTSLEHAFDRFPQAYRDDQLLVSGMGAESIVEQLEQQLPTVAAAPLRAVYRGAEPIRAEFQTDEPFALPRRDWIACGDDALLAALGAESKRSAFQSGAMLVFNPPAEISKLQLSTWVGDQPVDLPPIVPHQLDQPVAEPLYLIHESHLASHGWQPGLPLGQTLTPWLVRLDRPVTREVLDRARAIAGQSAQTSIDAAVLHDNPTGTFYTIVLALCLLTGLIIVLVATSLTAEESVRDSHTLISVGAGPRVVRAQAAARAAYLALLGCILAVPAGLIPAIGLFESANFPLEFVMPWRSAVLTILLLPALAFTLSWLTGIGNARTIRLREERL